MRQSLPDHHSCIAACMLVAVLVIAAPAGGATGGGDTSRDSQTPQPEPRTSSSDVVNPIYYPHSPRLRGKSLSSDTKVDLLLDQFVHLHTAMRYEDALEIIEQLIELQPDSAVMHYNHACVLGRLLRTEEAIDAIERAIKLGWRNLSHLQIDPDLHAVRWSERYEDVAERLAAKIRREQPSPGPLREESWETIVRDLEAVAPNLLASMNVPAMTISLVHEREHVWTGAFRPPASAIGSDEPDRVNTPDPQQTFHVEGPAQLLGVLGVLERWGSNDGPGVLRLVELVRHAARSEMASSAGSRPVGRQSPSDGGDRAAGVFARDERGSVPHKRRVVGDRILRISHVPDDVYDLLRMAVEHLSGDSFSRYCRQHALPTIGMNASDLVIVGDHRDRAVRRIAQRGMMPDDEENRRSEAWQGTPRLVLETSADDLAALIAHVLSMERSTREHMMNWHQISDHLLRSCVTRTLSIGSAITVSRTPFGLRTDVVSVGGGSGCVMRWYPQTGSGVAILFADAHGTGRRAAERLAHLALGGDH